MNTAISSTPRATDSPLVRRRRALIAEQEQQRAAYTARKEAARSARAQREQSRPRTSTELLGDILTGHVRPDALPATRKLLETLREFCDELEHVLESDLRVASPNTVERVSTPAGRMLEGQTGPRLSTDPRGLSQPMDSTDISTHHSSSTPGRPDTAHGLNVEADARGGHTPGPRADVPHFPAATPDGPLYCTACGPDTPWPHGQVQP